MNARRSLSALLLLPLCLAAGPRGDSLVFGPGKGLKVHKTFKSSGQQSLASMTMRVNGDEHPGPEGAELSFRSEETLEVTDEYLELAAGRPERLRRRYDALERESHKTVGQGGETTEQDLTGESALEGHVVLFTWSEEAQAFEAAFDDEKGPEELLPDLVEDMDLRSFLPGREVEAGDTWTVPAAAMLSILRPGGKLAILDAESSEEQDALSDQLDRALEGEVELEYLGRSTVDGAELGAIKIHAVLKSEAQQSADEEGQGASTVSLAGEWKGELRWDLASGRLHSAEIASDYELTILNKTELAREDREFHLENEMVVRCESRDELSFEAVE